MRRSRKVSKQKAMSAYFFKKKMERLKLAKELKKLRK